MGATPGSAPATPEWTRSRIALLPKALLAQRGFVDTWKSGCCVLHIPIFWVFPRLGFQSVAEFLSAFMYVCIYVYTILYLCCAVQHSFSPWKKCKSTQDVAHNSSLYKNSYFLILVCVEIHFFFQFLKYFWFDWAVEELECAWNKPLSGNAVEAQFCSLGSQCWKTTLCSVLVNRLEWRAKSDLRKLQHLLSAFKYFETSTPWDCFRIKWVMAQRK